MSFLTEALMWIIAIGLFIYFLPKIWKFVLVAVCVYVIFRFLVELFWWGRDEGKW